MANSTPPTPPQGIQQVSASRIAIAYYGSDTASVNPTIVTLIQQLIAMLLGGCTPPAAKERMNSRPSLCRMKARRFASFIAVDEAEAQQMADAAIIVGQQSTVEEYAQFQAAFPYQA